MCAHLLLLVVLLSLNIRHLWTEVRKISRRTWLILGVIFLFGFYLRNAEYWLGPFIDGYVYQESAHLWVLRGEFVKSCALGNPLDCKLFEQVLFLPGFPVIIALAHLVFGINSLNASAISAVMSSLTIILVFLAAYQLFRKSSVGLLSALVFTVIPINIIYSQTGLSRPTALFFFGLTVVSYLAALKNGKYVTWLWFAVSLSYFIYIRPEVYAIIPVFMFFAIVFKRKEIRIFLRSFMKDRPRDFIVPLRLIFLMFLSLILQLPALNWLLFDNPIRNLPGDGFYGLHFGGILMTGKALWLQLFNLIPGSGGNLYHYIFVISVFFVFGFLFLVFNRKKESFFIVSLWLAYFAVTALFYDGNISGTGELTYDYFRRSLMLNIPYSVIAGYGLYLVFSFLEGVSLERMLYPAIFLGILFISMNALNVDFDRNKIKESYKITRTFFTLSLFKDARAAKAGDKSLIHPDSDYWEIVEDIPGDCLVITSKGLIVTNDYFAGNKRRAAQTDLIFDTTENLFVEEIKENKCVYYIEDGQCRRGSGLYLCGFLENRLDKEFIFTRNDYVVYIVKLNDEYL
ncbi:MAG: glycosyltransferase family 39 protein [Candidatus Falkowbacteria bacterium]